MLTAALKSMIEAQKLCFAATVSAEGKPCVSPKGIRILDDQTVFLCDMNSPNTVKNLRSNPVIELNVVDLLSRKGYRLFGEATIHSDGNVFASLVQRVHAEGIPYKINTIILIHLKVISELISPLYDFVPTEPEMRKLYRERREILESNYERTINIQL